MNVLERIAALYAPHVCLGCGHENDREICDGCAGNLPRVPSRCYLCRTTTRNFEVCKPCRAHTPLRQVIVWGYYDDTVKALIRRGKFDRSAGALRQIGAMMAELTHLAPKDAIVIPVPTVARHVRERGYDHTLRIAKAMCSSGDLLMAIALARVGQSRQVGAKRAVRRAQLAGAFRPLNTGRITGHNVLLIDDVVTTGATLEEAARVLGRAGAKRVDAIVFAQTD